MQETDHATAPLQVSPGNETRDLLKNFFPLCPTCGYPYAANFAGMLHGLTSQPVCNGSMVHGICRPCIYMMFPYPPDALSWDLTINGEQYRGMLYRMTQKRNTHDEE